jgi:hypothetical protein
VADWATGDWAVAELPAALPAAGEELAGPAALGELVPADDGLLHAAASRAMAAVLRMAAAIRILGGRARRGGPSTGVPSCIVGFMSAVLRASR